MVVMWKEKPMLSSLSSMRVLSQVSVTIFRLDCSHSARVRTIIFSNPQEAAAGYAKTTALGYAALKTGSECSFTAVNSASSPVFALPNLRSLRSCSHSLLAGLVGHHGGERLV